jgi:hypothetical protein
MEIKVYFQAPAVLTPVKEPTVPINQDAGWAPEPVWMFLRTEKPFP